MGFQDRGYYGDRRSTFASEWTAVYAIIALNVAIWLANFILTGDLFRELFSLRLSLNDLLCLRSDLPEHPWQLWSLLTYGFLHDGPSLEQPNNQYSPMHLLFNMITLWFFGRELEDLMGRAEFLRFYCAAVVFAGGAWVVGEGFGGMGGRLVGASGGVMAVLAVFVWHFPRQTVLIYGVLPVPVWALGLLYLVSDVRGAAGGSGNVAHVAHLGGAHFGLLYAWRGWSLEDLTDLPARLLRRRPKMRIVRPDDETSDTSRPAARSGEDSRLDEEVDRILEKISRSGEGSLTAAERDTLTRASRRLKDRNRS